MKLTSEGSTSGGGDCPRVYSTDRGTIVVQGMVVTDPETLAHARSVLDGEAFVEVPIELVKYWPGAAELMA
jgi:hypothetical protein